jgi:uncharacterized protein YgbK (DUF1537 family)
MTRWRVAALADDLTGALEVGAKFASRGLDARVFPWPNLDFETPCGALVVDAGTRMLSAPEAAERMRGLAGEIARRGAELIYHKTDSTLRGNIAAEMRALGEAFGEREIVFAPAYPALGRMVLGGRLYVEGRPVEETAFARDPTHPVRTGDIGALVEGVPRVTIADGASEADLDAAARAVLSRGRQAIACGPAGLAMHLAALLGGEREIAWPRWRRALVVNGSLHERSLEQARRAREAWQGREGWDFCDRDTAARRWAEGGYDGAVVFGGDTAYRILSARDFPPLAPLGEILPGVPVTRCGDSWLVTKAGGFGAPDLLCRLRELLAQ